jgi:hypothetical protein
VRGQSGVCKSDVDAYIGASVPSVLAIYRFGDAYVAAYVDAPSAFEAASATTEISANFRSRAGDPRPYQRAVEALLSVQGRT